ncbi:unnamed protein product [Blepharisma stoltei]|uniref:Importin subunit alpha n=1 Tax=Blepharisma stoltei TaxID=1481888 RepID=A0AAU9IR24_9CILI|nr:unnamed protein product [Blepharisma stoltei]
MQDFMDSDESQTSIPIEAITELFSSMSVSPYTDAAVDTELKKVNLFEDYAIKYAISLISSSSSNQLLGARIIRRLLTKENEIPYEKVIQSNVLPCLIQLIPSLDEQFAYEVLWIISNLAVGEEYCIDYLLSQRSLELLNFILENCKSIEIFSQVMWAIGNIAGTNHSYRDTVIQQLNIDKIAYFLYAHEREFSTTDYQNIAWSIHNLVSNKLPPDLNKIKLFIPFLQKIIINQEDQWVLEDALSSYSIITDKYSDLDSSFNSQLLAKFCSLLDHQSRKINVSCLKNIGNYATQKIDQDFVIKSGLFPKLISFIDSSDKMIRKEAYWVMSNLVLDSNIYFSYLINSNFFEKFRKTLENDSVDVIKEAVWVICNFAVVSDFDQAKWLIDNMIIDLILEKLLINATIGDVIFDGLLNYFKFDNILEIKEISRYLETLENAKIHIGNNDNLKLEKVLQRLNEMKNCTDFAME